jgi:hypothetical protein
MTAACGSPSKLAKSDLTQVMHRLDQAQACFGPRRPPGGQDRLDQRPPGVGQVGAVGTPGGHDGDL